jgi:hypothetical protein
MLPPRRVAAPPPPRQPPPPNRPALSAEIVAELYSVRGLGTSATDLLTGAAKIIGDSSDLRERLEQKLWEASMDGLIPDTSKKHIDELRRILLL